jgi:hypothetical protein
MDRALSVAAAPLVVAWALATASPVQARQAPAAATKGPAVTAPIQVPGTLELPAGAALDRTRTYEAEIRFDGSRFRATLKGGAPVDQPPPAAGAAPLDPAAPSTPGQPVTLPGTAPATETSRWRLVLWIVIAALVAAALSAAALWYYFKRHVPKREQAPYESARTALRGGRYDEALRDLTGVEAKLPPAMRGAARFLVAFCHFQVGEEREAERLLADLHREAPADRDVAYFLAYLRVRRGGDIDAEPVLEAMKKDEHLEYRDTAWLLSIVKFRRATAAYEAGNIELAAELFAEVAQLKHLAAHVPADLRNRHIVLGTRALFDQDITTAREHFEALARVAQGITEAADVTLAAKASLGLALIKWLQDEPTGSDELERALVDACTHLHPDGALELPWPEPQPGSAKGDADALKRALEADDKNFDLRPEQRDVHRSLRDLHLLRALNVLRAWRRMDGAAAHAAIADRLAAVMTRLACARAIEERFSDVYLVAGLLLFYLHQPGPQRTTGLDLLIEARKLGMRVPDAMEIINNRERIQQENAGAADRYQQVLDRYLRDDTVRKEVRLDLLQRLSTHRSLMNRYKPPDLTRARTVPPTVQEMYLRSETLHVRVEQIGKTTASDELRKLGTDLKRYSEQLSQQAAVIERTEADLLALTGEELFKDS